MPSHFTPVQVAQVAQFLHVDCLPRGAYMWSTDGLKRRHVQMAVYFEEKRSATSVPAFHAARIELHHFCDIDVDILLAVTKPFFVDFERAPPLDVIVERLQSFRNIPC